MNSDLRYGFHLDDWLIEPLKDQVSRGGLSANLSADAMQVLQFLAENAGHTISPDELLERAWGTGSGSPDALRRAVSDIRHALEDTADNPKFIQQQSGGAYRLIVRPVLPSEKAAAGNPLAESLAPIEQIGLFDNLKQRGVFQAAIAYTVLGWLIIQVVDVLFDQLHLPDWAGTFVTVLVIAGFPITLVLSWFLEFRDGRAVLDDLPPEAANRRRFTRTYISIVAGLALAAVAVFIYDRNVGLPEPEKSAPVAMEQETVLPPVLDNSIAVLPFFNLDGSDETRIFTQGLVDDVTTRLSRVPGLLVSSRGDSFTLEPNTASGKVRERLRVARYLEGSVQMQGERMRIIVQLIDSDTGFHVLSRSFDRLREDFFDIRDEITALVVANVRVALPPDTQAASNISADDPSLDAYVLYRKGVEATRLPKTMETLEKALAWFDAALEIDPDYSAALAGKCSVFVQAYPVSDDPAYIDRAETACAQALELNPNLDIVHRALGALHQATGKYEQAEAAYLQALRIDPKNARSLSGLGTIHMLQKKPEEAEASFSQAIGLHPGDWSAYNSLGYFLYKSGRYAEAATQYEVVVALDNRNMVGYANLGAAYMLAGNFSASVKAFERANEIEPRPLAYSNLGLMYYYLGQFDKAIGAHGQAVKLAPNDHLSWSNLGDAFWIAGNEAQASNAFETAEQLATSALQVNPNDPGYLMDLAWITTNLGKAEEAEKLITRAHSQAPDDPYVHYYEGLMLLRGGNAEAALSSFATALGHGYSVQLLAADPQLAQLHENPRFREITLRANSQ